jgi:hypothetical protein
MSTQLFEARQLLLLAITFIVLCRAIVVNCNCSNKSVVTGRFRCELTHEPLHDACAHDRRLVILTRTRLPLFTLAIYFDTHAAPLTSSSISLLHKRLFIALPVNPASSLLPILYPFDHRHFIGIRSTIRQQQSFTRSPLNKTPPKIRDNPLHFASKQFLLPSQRPRTLPSSSSSALQ